MKKLVMPGDLARRVPPGQTLTDKFPVLSFGPTPRFNPEKWDFRVVGLIAEPLILNYQQFRALPQTKLVADFHCVTTWSRLDNVWEGVAVRDLIAMVKLAPSVSHVVIHCDGGYTTNLALSDFADD